MQRLNQAVVQQMLDRLKDQDLYIHLEMTTGAYASHVDSTKHQAANFLKNAVIRYTNGTIAGDGPYRVGLKMTHGWVYTEGLTHYEETETERLILAGHDSQDKLVVALQLSKEPF